MRPAKHSFPDRIRPHRRAIPAGFTLLEMLLVLAILVAITAVTIPVVDRMYDAHRIQQAAMEVRTALSAARLRAVDGGETMECRYEPDGRHLIVLVRQDQGIRFGDEDLPPRSPTAGRPREPLHVELPAPLVFWTADKVRQQRAPQKLRAPEIAGTALENRTWSAPIVFSPNGSSTDAVFEIRDPQGRAVTLDVRGLTGAASAATRGPGGDA